MLCFQLSLNQSELSWQNTSCCSNSLTDFLERRWTSTKSLLGKCLFCLYLCFCSPQKEEEHRDGLKGEMDRLMENERGGREEKDTFSRFNKKQTSPNPPFFQRGTKFPCAYSLPASLSRSLSCALSLAFSLVLSTSCTHSQRETCASETLHTHTNADWTIRMDGNILEAINIMWTCASKPCQPPFSLDKADETHMSYLSFVQQHMCQLIYTHMPDTQVMKLQWFQRRTSGATYGFKKIHLDISQMKTC